jgi:cellulose synthase operon protein C
MLRALALVLPLALGAACATSRSGGPSEPPTPPESSPEAPIDDDAPISAEAIRAVLQAELKLQEGDSPAAIQLLKEAVLFDPASPYLHVRLSEAHLEAGDAEQALIAARAALALDPRSVSALRVVAAAHTVTGDKDAARRSYERALEVAPGDRQTSNALAELLVEQGDVQGAERVIERLMDKEPGAVDGYVSLGRVFAQRGDVSRALAHLERALAREPMDPDALELELQIHEARGSFDDAVRIAERLARAVGDSPIVRRELLAVTALSGKTTDAEAMARSWLEEDTSESMALLVSDAWLRAGDLERALEALSRATGPRAELARARAAIALRRFEIARANACKSAEHAPDADARDVAVALCARAMIGLSKHKDAAALLLQHLDERSTSSVLLDTLAQLVRAPGEGVDRAALLLRLDRALHIAPHEADVVAAVSRAYEHVGDLSRARGAFDDALRARPSDPDLLFALARFLERNGQATGAVEMVERLVDRGRGDQDTFNFIAFSLADAKLRAEDARRYAWRALILDPLNGYVVDTLGWAVFATGDLTLARDTLLRADRLSPLEGEVLFHLATVEHARGDHAAARAVLERARPLLLDEPRVLERADALRAAIPEKIP